MPITLACTGCGKELEVPDSTVGRKFRCPKCGMIFIVPGAADDPDVGEKDPRRARLSNPVLDATETTTSNEPACTPPVNGKATGARGARMRASDFVRRYRHVWYYNVAYYGTYLWVFLVLLGVIGQGIFAAVHSIEIVGAGNRKFSFSKIGWAL
jgi:hypothetical protein